MKSASTKGSNYWDPATARLSQSNGGALLDERDLVHQRFSFTTNGSVIPFKSWSHTTKEKREEEEENYFLWRELSSFLARRLNSLCWVQHWVPHWKQGHITIGVNSNWVKELKLERSDFVFDRQPDRFRSRLRRAHQWLSGDHERRPAEFFNDSSWP